MPDPKITVRIESLCVAFDFEYTADDGPLTGWMGIAGVPNFSIPLDSFPEPVPEFVRLEVEAAAKRKALLHLRLEDAKQETEKPCST